MDTKSFFNLTEATILEGEGHRAFFKPTLSHSLETNWKSFQEPEPSRQTILDLFAGSIPAIRQKEFLSPDECSKMIDVLKSHKVVCFIT